MSDGSFWGALFGSAGTVLVLLIKDWRDRQARKEQIEKQQEALDRQTKTLTQQNASVARVIVGKSNQVQSQVKEVKESVSEVQEAVNGGPNGIVATIQRILSEMIKQGVKQEVEAQLATGERSKAETAREFVVAAAENERSKKTDHQLPISTSDEIATNSADVAPVPKEIS